MTAAQLSEKLGVSRRTIFNLKTRFPAQAPGFDDVDGWKAFIGAQPEPPSASEAKKSKPEKIAKDAPADWPPNLFQWSADRVEKELGVKRETFLRACADQEIVPLAKGRYTSSQVFRAMTSGLREQIAREKLRLTIQQADKLTLENYVVRGRLISIDFVRERNETIDTAIRAKIKNSSMSNTEKDDILRDIRELVGPASLEPDQSMETGQLGSNGSA